MIAAQKYLPVPKDVYVPPDGLPIRRERDQPAIGYVYPTSKRTTVELQMKKGEKLPDYIQFLNTWCRGDWMWNREWRDSTRD